MAYVEGFKGGFLRFSKADNHSQREVWHPHGQGKFDISTLSLLFEVLRLAAASEGWALWAPVSGRPPCRLRIDFGPTELQGQPMGTTSLPRLSVAKLMGHVTMLQMITCQGILSPQAPPKASTYVLAHGSAQSEKQLKNCPCPSPKRPTKTKQKGVAAGCWLGP